MPIIKKLLRQSLLIFEIFNINAHKADDVIHIGIRTNLNHSLIY